MSIATKARRRKPRARSVRIVLAHAIAALSKVDRYADWPDVWANNYALEDLRRARKNQRAKLPRDWRELQ